MSRLRWTRRIHDNARALGAEAIPLLLGALAALSAAWLGFLAVLWRRFRLVDPSGEVYRVALSRPDHEIALLRYRPEAPAHAEPVILCHGLAANRFNLDFFEDGSGSDRRSLARYLARRGFDVWLLELRGTGLARVPKGADWSIDDEVEEDLPTAIEAVLRETGAQRLFWVGHSKGGIMQYLLQGRRRPGHEKVAGLVAIGSPGTVEYQRAGVAGLVLVGRLLTSVLDRIPMRLLAVPLLPFAELIHFLGRRVLRVIDALDARVLRRLFANLPADISRGVANQLMEWVSEPERTLVGLEDASLREVRVPMLLVAGSLDPLAPPPAVEHVARRVGSSDVTFRVMGRAHGAAVEYGHGDLIIGDHAPEEVFPMVGDWLGARATPAPAGAAAIERGVP